MDKQTPQTDDLIVLPEFEVTAQRYKWNYIRTNHFELYTNLDDLDHVMSYARSFETCYNFVDAAFPEYKQKHEEYGRFILCWESTRKARFEEFFKTNNRWSSDMLTRLLSYDKKDGRLLEVGPPQQRADIKRNRMDFMYSLLRARLSYNTWRDIRKPETKQLSSQATAERMVWLTQAINILCDKFNYDDAIKHANYKVIVHNAPSLSKVSISTIFGKQFFDPSKSGAPEKYFETQKRDSMWQWSCFYFVYYCVFAEPERWRKSFDLFVARCAYHETNEESFTQCFGMSSKEFDAQMGAYSKKTRVNRANELPLVANDPQEKVESEKLAFLPVIRAMSARVVSDAFTLAGEPEKAYATLTRAIQSDPSVLRNMEFVATLGLCEGMRPDGDPDEAYRLLEESAKTKVSRMTRVYSALSYLRVGQIKKDKGNNYNLNAEEARFAAEPLEHALTLRNALDTYFSLTYLYARTNHEVPARVLDRIEEGLLLYPQHIELFEAAIPLLVEHDREVAARELLLNAYWHYPKAFQTRLLKLAELMGGNVTNIFVQRRTNKDNPSEQK